VLHVSSSSSNAMMSNGGSGNGGGSNAVGGGCKTTEELRREASAGNWTLAGDVDLRKHLECLADTVESTAKQLEESITDLESKLLATQTAIGNAHNRFSLLSHCQFVESRVYEDDDDDDEDGEEAEDGEGRKDKAAGHEAAAAATPPNPELDFVQNATVALQNSLAFVNRAFHQVKFDESDSEEEDFLVKCMEPVYESKNFYHLRNLPHVIGSTSFMSDDVIGLDHLKEGRSRSRNQFNKEDNEDGDENEDHESFSEDESEEEEDDEDEDKLEQSTKNQKAGNADKDPTSRLIQDESDFSISEEEEGLGDFKGRRRSRQESSDKTATSQIQPRQSLSPPHTPSKRRTLIGAAGTKPPLQRRGSKTSVGTTASVRSKKSIASSKRSTLFDDSSDNSESSDNLFKSADSKKVTTAVKSKHTISDNKEDKMQSNPGGDFLNELAQKLGNGGGKIGGGGKVPASAVASSATSSAYISREPKSESGDILDPLTPTTKVNSTEEEVKAKSVFQFDGKKNKEGEDKKDQTTKVFASNKKSIFDDSDDDDELFATTTTTSNKKPAKTKEQDIKVAVNKKVAVVTKQVEKPKKKPSLFSTTSSDEDDSMEDLFASVGAKKKPEVIGDGDATKNAQKTDENKSSTVQQSSDKKRGLFDSTTSGEEDKDMSSVKTSTKKKPIGGVAMFGPATASHVSPKSPPLVAKQTSETKPDDAKSTLLPPASVDSQQTLSNSEFRASVNKADSEMAKTDDNVNSAGNEKSATDDAKKSEMANAETAEATRTKIQEKLKQIDVKKPLGGISMFGGFDPAKVGPKKSSPVEIVAPEKSDSGPEVVDTKPDGDGAFHQKQDKKLDEVEASVSRRQDFSVQSKKSSESKKTADDGPTDKSADSSQLHKEDLFVDEKPKKDVAVKRPGLFDSLSDDDDDDQLFNPSSKPSAAVTNAKPVDLVDDGKVKAVVKKPVDLVDFKNDDGKEKALTGKSTSLPLQSEDQKERLNKTQSSKGDSSNLSAESDVPDGNVGSAARPKAVMSSPSGKLDFKSMLNGMLSRGPSPVVSPVGSPPVKTMGSATDRATDEKSGDESKKKRYHSQSHAVARNYYSTEEESPIDFVEGAMPSVNTKALDVSVTRSKPKIRAPRRPPSRNHRLSRISSGNPEDEKPDGGPLFSGSPQKPDILGSSSSKLREFVRSPKPDQMPPIDKTVQLASVEKTGAKSRKSPEPGVKSRSPSPKHRAELRPDSPSPMKLMREQMAESEEKPVGSQEKEPSLFENPGKKSDLFPESDTEGEKAKRDEIPSETDVMAVPSSSGGGAAAAAAVASSYASTSSEDLFAAPPPMPDKIDSIAKRGAAPAGMTDLFADTDSDDLFGGGGGKSNYTINSSSDDLF